MWASTTVGDWFLTNSNTCDENVLQLGRQKVKPVNSQRQPGCLDS